MVELTSEFYLVEIDDFDPDLMIAYAPPNRCVAVVAKNLNAVELQHLKLMMLSKPVPDQIKSYIQGNPSEKYIPRIRINVTQKCNLRCIYCAVDEGDRNLNIDSKALTAAIERLFQDAEEHQSDQVQITFSGGEPTVNLPALKLAVNIIKHKSADLGVVANFHMLTNGVFSENIHQFLLENFARVQISYDGAFSDGTHRPLPNGEDSSSIVFRNIERLYERGLNITVRITVGPNNIDYLEEIVSSIRSIGEKINIDVGIIVIDGRAKRYDNDYLVDASDFVKKYIDVWQNLSLPGSEVGFGGTDLGSISTFICGISRPATVLCPSGDLSACTRVIDKRHPLADKIFYGKFSEDQFIIDEENVSNLQKINFLNIKECQTCFCKWHCVGGCPLDKPNFDMPLDDYKCKVIKDINRIKLLHQALRNENFI
jgi:uncharacterized protein